MKVFPVRQIQAFYAEREKSGNYLSPSESQSPWSQTRVFRDELGKGRRKEGRERGREGGKGEGGGGKGNRREAVVLFFP